MPSTPPLQRFSSDVGWERQIALFGTEPRSWIEPSHPSHDVEMAEQLDVDPWLTVSHG